MNNKNFNENLLTFLSMNNNEIIRLGRDDLERDPVRTDVLCLW